MGIVEFDWPISALVLCVSLKFSKKMLCVDMEKPSKVNTLPKAKSKTRSKQNKDMQKCSSVYGERGVPLPVLTSGGE